jgi:hypothetical protein
MLSISLGFFLNCLSKFDQTAILRGKILKSVLCY